MKVLDDFEKQQIYNHIRALVDTLVQDILSQHENLIEQQLVNLLNKKKNLESLNFSERVNTLIDTVTTNCYFNSEIVETIEELMQSQHFVMQAISEENQGYLLGEFIDLHFHDWMNQSTDTLVEKLKDYLLSRLMFLSKT